MNAAAKHFSPRFKAFIDDTWRTAFIVDRPIAIPFALGYTAVFGECDISIVVPVAEEKYVCPFIDYRFVGCHEGISHHLCIDSCQWEVRYEYTSLERKSTVLKAFLAVFGMRESGKSDDGVEDVEIEMHCDFK